MPTVSVIVPAYNVERYLAEAIESVLAQTFDDWEIVIVNDGSTDRTPSIAEQYRRRHPNRIRVASHENRGLAAARNTALEIAGGRLLALLDSDDTWRPTFLAEQIRILEARPDVAIVTGNAFTRGGPDDGWPARPIDDRRPVPDLVEILRDETAVFIMSVFRREVVDRIGGFDERFRTNEDYDFWIRAALAGFVFARNPQPLGYYRRHASSLSANEVRMISGILRVFHKTLPSLAGGSPARQVAVQQIARFEAELLLAETRAALDRGDVSSAARAIRTIRRLQARHAPATWLAAALLRVPRLALWTYRMRARVRARLWRRGRTPMGDLHRLA